MSIHRFLPVIALGGLLLAATPAGADFGPLGVDTRELGMGGAAAADAEGPSAVYWNPAGLRRTGGLRAVVGFGMLQHPDPGELEYGVTDRPFLAAAWGPEDEKGLVSIGAALERPFPRFGYDGTDTVLAGPSSTLSRLDVTSSQDYLELLAGVGVRAWREKISDLTATVDLGFAIGLGFSSNFVHASLDDYGSAWAAEFHEASGTSLLLPGGIGLAVALEGRVAKVALGVRYRGVLALGDEPWVSFEQSGFELTEADLFMPPPQEGGIGIAVTFFRQLTYSLEFAYVFFDAPDAFPNHVPHNYSVLKFGVEYRVPFQKETRALAMRFGVSQSMIDSDALPSIFTTESTGVYFGWGVVVDPLARFDAYFTIQVPGEGDVDANTFLASVSYGLTF
jgi:hypothetical protein